MEAAITEHAATPGSPAPIILTATETQELLRFTEYLEQVLRLQAVRQAAQPESWPGADILRNEG